LEIITLTFVTLYGILLAIVTLPRIKLDIKIILLAVVTFTKVSFDTNSITFGNRYAKKVGFVFYIFFIKKRGGNFLGNRYVT